jgi:hypothetical protein
MREHSSPESIDFEQKPIKIESLNERDVIVNRKSFLKLLFPMYRFRSSFFYVHNKMYIYMLVNRSYTHIYFFHHHIYVHNNRRIGGKQPLKKRRS